MVVEIVALMVMVEVLVAQEVNWARLYFVVALQVKAFHNLM
jgi:hypothetical protein